MKKIIATIIVIIVAGVALNYFGYINLSSLNVSDLIDGKNKQDFLKLKANEPSLIDEEALSAFLNNLSVLKAKTPGTTNLFKAIEAEEGFIEANYFILKAKQQYQQTNFYSINCSSDKPLGKAKDIYSKALESISLSEQRLSELSGSNKLEEYGFVSESAGVVSGLKESIEETISVLESLCEQAVFE
jgi:hypothetical protein